MTNTIKTARHVETARNNIRRASFWLSNDPVVGRDVGRGRRTAVEHARIAGEYAAYAELPVATLVDMFPEILVGDLLSACAAEHERVTALLAPVAD